MDSGTPARGGRHVGAPGFNGGLFAEIDPIYLLPAELDIPATAADRKRDLVNPEIFGTLFPFGKDAGGSHATGLHLRP